MLFFPEEKIHKFVNALFGYLIENYNACISNGTENISHLFLLFAGEIESTTVHPYYAQAKEILTRSNSNPRQLQVRPFFDRERASLPTIHIVTPQDFKGISSLGDYQGDSYSNGDLKLQNHFQTTIRIICTSDNIVEIDILVYILRALLIASVASLQVLGFINPKFSCQSLEIEPTIQNPNTLAKGISMDAQYFETVPPIKIEVQNQIIRNIYFIYEGIKSR